MKTEEESQKKKTTEPFYYCTITVQLVAEPTGYSQMGNHAAHQELHHWPEIDLGPLSPISPIDTLHVDSAPSTYLRHCTFDTLTHSHIAKGVQVTSARLHDMHA